MSAVQYTAIQHRALSPAFPRKYLYLRIAGYALLEGAFLTVAALAFAHPLVISTFLSQTNAKAVFTVVFIMWHFLATQCLQEIIKHIFASEWQYIMRGSNSLIPGATDHASTLVSGYLDFLPHFFTRHASTAFRLALPAQLICLAISGFLPGTVIFTSVQINSTIPLQVANLTNFTNFPVGQPRAEVIVQVEIQEDSIFGLDTEINWIVGWPKTPENFDEPIVYPTDVVHYDFNCHWEAPEINSSRILQSGGGARQWGFPSGIPIQNMTYFRAISQVVPKFGPGNLVAFLFFGSNETYQVPAPFDAYIETSWGTILNLDGIPTTHNASGFYLSPTVGVDYITTAPLAALLVCDPQLHITSAQAVIWPNKTLNVVKSTLGASERLGNFLDHDVGAFFRIGSMDVFQSTLISGSWTAFGNSILNFNCAFTFLNDSALSQYFFRYGEKGIFPLPIAHMEANLNKVFRSIFKAYSNGVRNEYMIANGIFHQDTTPVQAVTRRTVQALVTNTNLIYIAVVLVVAELLLMGALCAVRDWRDRDPLNLGSIFAAIGKDPTDVEIDRRNMLEINHKANEN